MIDDVSLAFWLLILVTLTYKVSKRKDFCKLLSFFFVNFAFQTWFLNNQNNASKRRRFAEWARADQPPPGPQHRYFGGTEFYWPHKIELDQSNHAQ